MRGIWNSGRMLALGMSVVCAAPLIVSTAEAKSHHAARGHARYVAGGYGSRLQCVPFARENSGIELAGNANMWWSAAQGVYERGARPEVGSVLNFRANGRMRMGHVAVVTRVIDPRNIEIDHANWSGGRVSRNIQVVDVSPTNDWSAVRVELTQDGSTFGSVYPTYGFIYDRPDHGVMVANNTVAPLPVLNTAPRDLRPADERFGATTADDTEVAEAPDDAAPARASRRFARHAHSLHETRVAKAGGRGHATTVARSSRAEPRVAVARTARDSSRASVRPVHNTAAPAAKKGKRSHT